MFPLRLCTPALVGLLAASVLAVGCGSVRSHGSPGIVSEAIQESSERQLAVPTPPEVAEPDPNSPTTIARITFRSVLDAGGVPNPARLEALRADWLRRGTEAWQAGDRISAERSWRVGLLLGLSATAGTASLADGRELLTIPLLRANDPDEASDWLRYMSSDEELDGLTLPKLGTTGNTTTSTDHMELGNMLARAMRHDALASDVDLVIGEPTSLLVVATPAAAARIRASLGTLPNRDGMIRIEARVHVVAMQAAEAWLKSIGAAVESADGKAHEPTLTILGSASGGIRECVPVALSEAQLKELQALATAPTGKLLSGPAVTTLEGQLAHVAMLNQISYIRDFEITQLGDSIIASPVVDTITEGLSVACRARSLADGRFLAAITVSNADLLRPIAAFTTTVAGGAEVTIQIPNLKISEASTTGILEAEKVYILSNPVRVVVSANPTAGRSNEVRYLITTFQLTRPFVPSEPND